MPSRIHAQRRLILQVQAWISTHALYEANNVRGYCKEEEARLTKGMAETLECTLETVQRANRRSSISPDSPTRRVTPIQSMLFQPVNFVSTRHIGLLNVARGLNVPVCIYTIWKQAAFSGARVS